MRDHGGRRKSNSTRGDGDRRNRDDEGDAETRAFRDAMRDIWKAEGRVEILLG